MPIAGGKAEGKRQKRRKGLKGEREAGNVKRDAWCVRRETGPSAGRPSLPAGRRRFPARTNETARRPGGKRMGMEAVPGLGRSNELRFVFIAVN